MLTSIGMDRAGEALVFSGIARNTDTQPWARPRFEITFLDKDRQKLDVCAVTLPVVMVPDASQNIRLMCRIISPDAAKPGEEDFISPVSLQVMRSYEVQAVSASAGDTPGE